MQFISMTLVFGFASLSLPLAADAKPFDPALTAQRRCTPATLMIPAAHALAEKADLSTLSSGAHNVKLTTETGGKLRIESMAGSMETTGILTPSLTACGNADLKQTLSANDNQVPAAYLKAVVAVEQYRASPARRGPRADVSQANSEVVTAAYGSHYILVLFNDNLRSLVDGRVSLGCDGEEFFRYDTERSAVLQYDGCLEGRTPALPRFSDLPD